MPLEAKPQSWVIMPGRGYLKSSNPLVSESLIGTGSPSAVGMTQTDKARAENRAWFRILMYLVCYYDVSGWGSDPPTDLESEWEMLAAAYYRLMEIGALGMQMGQDERRELLAAPMAWIKSVQADLVSIADTNGDICLIDSSGNALLPIAGLAAPEVAGFDLTLFPGNDDEYVNGVAIGGSLEEFQKRHGMASLTLGRGSPVPWFGGIGGDGE